MTNTVWISKIEDENGDTVECNGVFHKVEPTKVKHHNHNKYRLNENLGAVNELVYVAINKSVLGMYLTFRLAHLNDVG